MKDPRSIILAPVVSEKTYALIEDQNIYTFQVDRRTNKTEIKMAVAAVFGVKVVNVNTINRKGKLKRTGAHVGKRKDVKHAMVKLADGESIEIFGA
jgi:large subunit ribosomal protein L23